MRKLNSIEGRSTHDEGLVAYALSTACIVAPEDSGNGSRVAFSSRRQGRPVLVSMRDRTSEHVPGRAQRAKCRLSIHQRRDKKIRDAREP